jgi:hypothetical protein
MTFIGLLLRFAIGYACGLLARPLLSRPLSEFGDNVSMRGGIAGGLGASVPYLLLNSILVTDIPPIFIAHEHWVSAAVCLLAIGGVEFIAGPTPQSESQRAAAEHVASPLLCTGSGAFSLESPSRIRGSFISSEGLPLLG